MRMLFSLEDSGQSTSGQVSTLSVVVSARIGLVTLPCRLWEREPQAVIDNLRALATDIERLTSPVAIAAGINAPGVIEAVRPGRGAAIKSSMTHDAGAYARCSGCGRYSDDPRSLLDGHPCDCGKVGYWSGSFQPPTAESQWSEAKPVSK